MRNLSPPQVQQLLDDERDLLLLDVRERWEFEICNIQASINISMGDIPATAENLDSDKENIFICHHGSRSMQVAGFLEHAGFANVINLDGGIDAWARTIDPEKQQY